MEIAIGILFLITWCFIYAGIWIMDEKIKALKTRNKRDDLIAFIEEMQNIGLNFMDKAEKVVDNYLKQLNG